MVSKDIVFTQISDAFPEQYDAHDNAGNVVGYVRIRWGWCAAYCPDAGGSDEVYTVNLRHGLSCFASGKERKRHLRRAKACIAAWCNDHPGVFGDIAL